MRQIERALQTPKEEATGCQQSTHVHKADTVVPDLIKDNAGVSPSGLAEAPSIKGGTEAHPVMCRELALPIQDQQDALSFLSSPRQSPIDLIICPFLVSSVKCLMFYMVYAASLAEIPAKDRPPHIPTVMAVGNSCCGKNTAEASAPSGNFCRATLVICPLVAVIQWRQEIARFTAQGTLKVLLTAFNAISSFFVSLTSTSMLV